MINAPINSLPVQQAAVQQQIQQNQVPVMMSQPQQPASEFNAIKINITGATVGTPGQDAYAPYQPAGQKLNYLA